MKKGWTYKKLGEVAAFMSGYTPDKSELISQGKYPYFKVAEMNNPGNELFMRYTSFFIDSPKKVFPKGSIIFPKNGGAIYTEKKRILEYDSVIDLNSEAIFPNEQIVLKYLFCFLNHIKISSFDKGGGLPSLDLKKMANCLIPLPALSEQNKIVKRLDAAFAQIDELKANAEKQLAEARTLFQKSLAKAMEPKEGWEEKTLGDVCKSVNYGTSLPSTENGKYKYLRMNNITIDGTLDLTNLKTIDVPEKDFEKCVVRKGDLLFNRTNSPELVGKTCIFKEDEEMIIAGYIIRIRFNDSIYPQFASYFINLQRQLGNLRPLIVGAVHQANISAKAIQSINIQFPPLAEQQRIVERLDSISENVRKYEEIQRKIIAECDALKQALLRQVFE